MGASNALAAYRTYGSLVGDRSLRILVYMALVARDRDSEPWCQIGHQALSEFALSRPVPAIDNRAARRQALRIVERVMTELADAGAVRTIKRATYGRRGTTPARYRLYLDKPCADARAHRSTRQKSSGSPSVNSRREVSEPTRQKNVVHPSENGRPPVTERRTKEYEEEEERYIRGFLQSTRAVEGTHEPAPDLVENQMSAIEREAWAAIREMSHNALRPQPETERTTP